MVVGRGRPVADWRVCACDNRLKAPGYPQRLSSLRRRIARRCWHQPARMAEGFAAAVRWSRPEAMLEQLFSDRRCVSAVVAIASRRC
ncbi:hypothetical protein KCP74_12970 [Salmonella enterica subsp. enterica]|nr:hypothetical protein KCP74_12970 [Salmonella enterica subsp. enterica]